MIKKMSLLLWIGLVISLLSTFIISRASKKLHKDNVVIGNKLNDCEFNSNRLREKYEQSLFSENKYLANITLVNSNMDTIPLTSIVNNTKLIYRFYQDTCVQCYEDELDIIKELGNKIGSESIIIISDFDRMNTLKSIINRKKVESPYFIYKEKFELPIELDDQRIASFFLLDKNLQTRFVFKAGGEQNINDIYYKRIIDYFNMGY